MEVTEDTKYPVEGSAVGINRIITRPVVTTAVTATRGAGLVDANPRFPAIKPRETNAAVGEKSGVPPILTKELNEEANFTAWAKAEQLRRTQSGAEPLRSAVQAVDSYRAWLTTQPQNISEPASLIKTVGNKTELPYSNPVTTALKNPAVDKQTDATGTPLITRSESSTKYTPSSEPSSDTAQTSSLTASNTQAELDRLREISRLTQQISLTRSIRKTGGNGKRKVTWPDSKEPVVVSNGQIVSGDPYADTAEGGDGGSDADESEGGDDTDAEVDDIYEGLMARFDVLEQKTDVIAKAVCAVEKAFVDLAVMLGAKRN